MPTEPVATEVEKGIQSLATGILAKRPQLEGILKPFAALFIEKARLTDDLASQLAPLPFDSIGKRLEEGVPVLSGISFTGLKPALDYAFTALAPAVKAWFPALLPSLDGIENQQRAGALDLSRLAEEYVAAGLDGLEGTGPAEEVDRHCLGFMVQLALSAVLQAVAPRLATQADAIRWGRGYCPLCGSLPFISYLSKPQSAPSEFLVGGGGQRYLHCAVCGHDWHVRRHLCAACETDDSDQHLYFNVADAVGERVDICPRCSHYLPCIDLRETDAPPHLDTMAVGLAHLDMLAQEKGFHPMVRTPWNTFE